VNPSAKKALATTSIGDFQNITIPRLEDRPSIDDVILELQEQDWYKDQIVDRRTFEAKESIEGSNILYGYFPSLIRFMKDRSMSLFRPPFNKLCKIFEK